MVAIIVAVICVRGGMLGIWEYVALFLAFMAVFCHLMSFLLMKMSPRACKKLDEFAGGFGILAVIAIVVIFILNFIIVN